MKIQNGCLVKIGIKNYTCAQMGYHQIGINHFKIRLMTLPVSFKQTCRQVLEFRKALGQVIEMPGLLHQEFHLLQCICNMFLELFKWSATVIGQKRINYKEVSQNFHLCRQLAFLMLEELECLAFDQLASQNEDYLNKRLKENGDEQ